MASGAAGIINILLLVPLKVAAFYVKVIVNLYSYVRPRL